VSAGCIHVLSATFSTPLILFGPAPLPMAI
jgi:hypothetical protein